MSATLLRALAVLLVGLVLAGCARVPPKARIALPTLHLAPSSYGGSVALQQRLRFAFGTQRREMDALLEIDAGVVRLAVQAMARTGVTLVWDGTTLEQTRADWLPAAVRGERVLDDLQFVHWPLDAIQAALPSGWTVERSATDGIESRRLLHRGEVWLEARYPAPGTIELDNRAEGYRLTVQSIALSAGEGGAMSPRRRGASIAASGAAP